MEQKRKVEDEIKFKDLAKSPLRLYGWVYPIFFVLFLVFGIYFGHHIIKISFNEQDVSAPDSTNIKKEIVEKKGGVTPAVDLNTIKTPTKEMIAKGKELYDANCQSCHGSTGMGDGPAGMVLNPKPRNYHVAEGWTNGRTIDEMYRTLQEGITKNGMASYEYLPPSDRIDIISYIRTFTDFPEITDNELNKLNLTYNLSATTVTPNSIPVNKAEQKLESENAALVARINAIKSKIDLIQTDIGKDLLRHSTANLDMVLKSFIESSENQNFDKFFNSVSNAPIIQGYKASVLEYSVDQWKTLFDFLKSVTA